MSASQPYPFLNPTYVFSDIEDSSVITRRLEKSEGIGVYETQLRDRYLRLVEEKFRESQGHLIQLVGDGHLIVFQYAHAALAFAIALQKSLHSECISYGTGANAATIRIRIGIHTAENQREYHRMDNDLALIEYPGSDTNFAARILSLGDGGQIIVSAETCRQTNDLAGYRSHAWPNRYLKSFDEEPHTVCEILYFDGQTPLEPGIRFFPSFYKGEPNRYVDRETKERDVIAQFKNKQRDGKTSQLVTIHAEGGMGKTRLAIACAVKMIGLFEGHAHFVNLAFSQPTVEAIAEAIGKAMEPPIEPALPANVFAELEARGTKRTLLILDNYESVQDDDVARYLAKLATKTLGVHLLVTGRKMVGVDEIEHCVSLDDGMSESEARDLFLVRARLKKPDWTPSKAEEHELRRILQLTSVVPESQEINAIPLAVELAAAWVRFPLKKIAADLLKEPLGPMTQPIPGHVRADDEETLERHRSLTRSFDWSYKLLGEVEGREAQQVFESCGLFASSFDPDAVAVASGIGSAERQLILLENSSLVRPAHTEAGDPRYRLHRFTRAYASEKLAESPEADSVKDRFVEHYVALIETNVADQLSINGAECRAVLENEWRNVISASEVAETIGNLDAIIALGNLRAFFHLRGEWLEWESLEKRVLTAARAAEDQGGEGGALTGLGNIYFNKGRWNEAVHAYKQAVQLFHTVESWHDEAMALHNLGGVYHRIGLWDEGIKLCEWSLKIRLVLGDRHGQAQTLTKLGDIYGSQSQWSAAAHFYKQSLPIASEIKDLRGEGLTRGNLGVAYKNLGRLEEAIQEFEQDLSISKELGDRYSTAQTLGNLGNVYMMQGFWNEAITKHEEALSIAHEFGDQHLEAQTLGNLGNVFGILGRWDEALLSQKKSRLIFRQLNDHRGEGITLFGLTSLQALRGDLAGALPFARDAVAAIEKTQDVALLAKARELLAEIEAAIAESQR